ncbi:hypothetical protein BO71DRAFT_436671 [Aspergillus ellipticus CBS 707.79]|uniref:Uncharacterized protein n=1 Tax=Aspergillus ellipticus CBS 707.79 TaxID=1448320 RepID=A0A319E8T6_9EURO|nr:hypothetical protein BO71DRAFT_436671 [Aspergillus ellipticus CBS 707.79]
MGVIKRVQKYLRAAENRATAKLLSGKKKGGAKEEGEVKEVVFVKATGRAMERALKVGKWFEAGGREKEFGVRVETGCVLVVDDLDLEGQGGGEEEEEGEGLEGKGGKEGGEEEEEEEEEVPETRTRWVNTVQVAVSLK